MTLKSLLTHIEGYFSSKFGMTRNLLHLLKLEANLARVTFPWVLAQIGLLIAFCLASWLLGMGVLILLLLPYLGIFLTVVLLFGLNVGVSLVLLHRLKRQIKEMSFEKTRQFLTTPKEESHESKKEVTHRD